MKWFLFLIFLKCYRAQCETFINASRLEEIILNLNIVRPPGSAGLDQGFEFFKSEFSKKKEFQNEF